MTREELLKSLEFWIGEIQINLFNLLREFMEERNINRSQLADLLGVTKGYVSQILNGDFDHRISKLVQLSMAIGKVPLIKYVDIEQVMLWDEYGMLYDMINEMPGIELNIDPSSKISLPKDTTEQVRLKKITQEYNQTISLLNYTSCNVNETAKAFAIA